MDVANATVTSAELAEFPHLTSVHLVKTGISDADLVHLRGAVKLESLDLSDNPLTGRGFDALASLTSLKVLILAESTVERGELKRLAALPKLERVDCQRTPLTAADAQALANTHGWTFAGECSCGCMDIAPERR